MLKSFEIAPNRFVGEGHPCFLIAEAGSNWRMGTPQRDRAMARNLIEVAAESGCDAVKFQTYRADTVYVENAGESDYLAEVGIKKSIREIFEDLSMSYDMLEDLSRYCHECGIHFTSTPFSIQDAEAVDPFVRFHKIASYEISHTELQAYLARSGKPIMFSTGAAEWEDIDFAISHLKQHGASHLAVMQCTAKYPAPFNSLNLRIVPALKQRYGIPVGFSDHSRDPIIGPVTAVSLGANIVEKHYTLSNRLPGADHPFALEPAELRRMVEAVRRCEESMGSGDKSVTAVEEELFKFARRGIQAVRPIRRGDKFELGQNIAILRPGKQPLGVHPRYLSLLEAGVASCDLKLGEGVQLDHVTNNLEV